MKIGFIYVFICMVLTFSALLLAEPAAVRLYAAGSLKAALGEIVVAYEKSYKVKVISKFGPSGLLKKEIEEGAAADIFASANMEHPEALAAEGWGDSVRLFAKNKLCVLAKGNLRVPSDQLLDTLLDKDVRVGISTPKSDPSGDYAMALFKQADKIRAGSFAILSGKALKLTGGRDSAQPPEGWTPYAWLMKQNQADIFLTYCTNALLAQKDLPELQIIQIPKELNIGADYGFLIAQEASAEARRFGAFILSPAGQNILRAHGFGAAKE
jgi:molybdate transport system substrate-binding protein